MLLNGQSPDMSTSSSPAGSPIAKSGSTAFATPIGTPNSSGTPVVSTPTIFEPLYASSVTHHDEFSDLSKRLFLAYYDIYQVIGFQMTRHCPRYAYMSNQNN